MLLVFTVILVALIFTYTNGFHDTANSIATVVGTKVLTPRQAILLATVTNLLGAMTGAADTQRSHRICPGAIRNTCHGHRAGSLMLRRRSDQKQQPL